MDEEYAIIAALGKKIGIKGLGTQDFDLIFGHANSVEKFCDQFASIELTPNEKFHLMQLIVASLDEAIRTNAQFAHAAEQRVEQLLSSDPHAYEYIIDYWASVGTEDAGTSVRPMMRRLIRQWDLTSFPFSGQ